MTRRRAPSLAALALWVLALDALLLVPLTLRARHLRDGWAAWNTAAAANVALLGRQDPAHAGHDGEAP